MVLKINGPLFRSLTPPHPLTVSMEMRSGAHVISSASANKALTPYHGTEITLFIGGCMKSLTIGELAGAAEVGVETIRFYERKGLIPQPLRPQTGYRKYGDDVADRVRFIRRAQELGFTLAEIKQLLELRLDPRRDCADVKSEAETKIADIDTKIASLRVMRTALIEITRSCSGEGPTSACPILDAIEASVSRRKRTGNTDHGTA
ncbi:MAG TPA: MerR family DNA-binding protein [Thermoanaerobaculia bacterium]|nr:MerR family DNA-binding protein [Thermoanaerobaculia bacterium]